MKRIYFISFVAAAMIFFSADMKSSARINDNLGRNTLAFITYQVNVHPDNLLLGNSCLTYVEIRNGEGLIIGQSQPFHTGVNTYYFYELGPVNGIRQAFITNTGGSDRNIEPCLTVNWWDTKTGTFRNSQNYTFNLWSSNPIKESNMVNDD